MDSYYLDGMKKLVMAVQELSYARTQKDVVQILKTVSRRLVGADGAALVLRDGDQCHYVDEDAISPLWKNKKFPMSACVSGWSMLHRESVMIPDIFHDSRIPIDAYKTTFVRSLVVVPIRKENPIGAIGTYWSTNREAKPEEVELLQALADSASVAFENITLFQNYQKSLAETENALSALKSRTLFLARISHEIRNPLHTIIGMTEVMSENSSQAELDIGLPVMKRAGELLMGLSKDFLDLAKIESEKMTIEHISFSVRDVLDACSSLVSRQAKDKNLIFSVDADPFVPSHLIGDPHRIKQALLNFLINAVKFTRSGSVSLKVKEVDRNNTIHTIRFSVRDTGPGIPLQLQKSVFGKFDQVQESTSRTFGGSGLGLNITRELAKLMGGKVGFDSTEGVGSHFFIELPLKYSEESDKKVEHIVQQSNSKKTLKILVADDQEDNRLLLKLYLEDFFSTIDFAENGREALAKWEQSEYDLVLMDMHMPKMTGAEVLRRIRDQEAAGLRKHTPIFALSASEDETLMSGAEIYLQKPFTRKELRDAVSLIRSPGASSPRTLSTPE